MRKKYSIFMIEGIEGSGKSGVINVLKKIFSSNKKVKFIESKHVRLHEFGLLDEGKSPLREEIEYLIVEVLTTQEIFDLIKENNFVIMERGFLSTRVYGLVRSKRIQKILPEEYWVFQHNILQEWFHKKELDISQMVVTIYLDIEPNEALRHIENAPQGYYQPNHLTRINKIDWLNDAKCLYEVAFQNNWMWVEELHRIDVNEKTIRKISRECFEIIKDYIRRK